MNIWQEFAALNRMTQKQFEDEIISTAQAVLAMKLNEDGEDELKIIAGQHDGVYQLNFKRIIK
jgi:flavorubredoxin